MGVGTFRNTTTKGHPEETSKNQKKRRAKINIKTSSESMCLV